MRKTGTQAQGQADGREHALTDFSFSSTYVSTEDARNDPRGNRRLLITSFFVSKCLFIYHTSFFTFLYLTMYL